MFGTDCVGEGMDEPALSSSLDGGRERDGVAAGMGGGCERLERMPVSQRVSLYKRTS